MIDCSGLFKAFAVLSMVDGRQYHCLQAGGST